MLNPRFFTIITLLLSWLSFECLADEPDLLEMPLEELMNINVRTASKGDEAIGDAAAVISTISRDEISRFGANNLAEVLERSTSLLLVGSSMLPQNLASIRGDITGQMNSHVLILLNDRPVREGLFGGWDFPIYSAFPVAMIEKIEVIRGPGSVLYGSNAYSGVINIITQKTKKEGLTGRVAAKGGSYNSQGVDANGSWKKGDLSVNSGLQSFRDDGWKFSAIDERGVNNATLWGKDNLGLFFNANYKELSLDYHWSDTKQAHVGLLPIWGGDQSLANDKHFINLGWNHRFSDRWRLTANGTYNMNASRFLNFAAFKGQPGFYPTTQHSRDGLFEVTNYFESGKWKWMLGGSVNVMSGENYTENNGQIFATGIASYIEPWYSVYTQIDYQILESLKLTIGAQGIKTNPAEWGSVPRFGAVYHFNKEAGVKLLYGEAFRAPYRFETSMYAPGVFMGNSALLPEMVATFDAQMFYNSGAYQYTATYFHSIQSELISRTPVPGSTANTLVNKGGATLEGVELEGKLNLDKFYLTSSATYQTNHNSAGLNDYTTAPTLMAKLGLSYKFTPQLTAGLFNSFVTNYHDTQNHFSDVTTKIVNPEPKPYNLMTLKIDYDFANHFQRNKPVKLNFYAYNLLNEDIYLSEFYRGRINSIPGKQGRGFYVGFEYNF